MVDDSQPTAVSEQEVRSVTEAAGRMATLMRCRFVPVAWKLRAAGVSEALIRDLCDG